MRQPKSLTREELAIIARHSIPVSPKSKPSLPARRKPRSTWDALQQRTWLYRIDGR